MATIREKCTGVGDVCVFAGRDDRGRPTQISRTVRGGKRDAQRVIVQLDGGPGRSSAAGRTVRDVLDEWVEHNVDTWAASSARDQRSRVKAIKSDDKLARMPVERLSVADVEQWHARLAEPGSPKWWLHDLRNWSATTAIGQGHDVRTVAGRLGHSDPSMTLRTYAHAFAAADTAVAQGLGELLDGTVS